MTLRQPGSKLEREKRVQEVIAFASSFASRCKDPPDPGLLTELQAQIRHLPLQASPAVIANRGELDKLGTELWNLSTRMRRDKAAQGDNNSEADHQKLHHGGIWYLLRAYAFLLLDSASTQTLKARECKPCIRLMRVALKAAKACIMDKDLAIATKVLERAAVYVALLTDGDQNSPGDDVDVVKRLQLEYFAIRTVLAFRQDRLDTAEHMFAKYGQIGIIPSPEAAEDIADLYYEIGKQALTKRNFESAVKWLERSYGTLEEQEIGMLSPETGELRLCVMQGLTQAHIELKTDQATNRAWDLVKLMEADYGDKMVVPLLKIELLSAAEHIDAAEYYHVLARMIRTIVLNDNNFKTLIYHIHTLKNHSNVYACKAIDDLLKDRLIREDNALWIEKAVITQIWISTGGSHAEDVPEQLQQTLDLVLQEAGSTLSAPATHAAQTLLWKKVEDNSTPEQHAAAEAWCRLCLHPMFDKAGPQNRVKITRKLIQIAFDRQDYTAAHDLFRKSPDSGRDEPVTRYIMYKVSLRCENAGFAAECLDVVCRASSKDATLLYACVMEAQSIGNKRQAIHALEKVLGKFDYAAPVGIHLPALLRVTLRLLQSELLRDGIVDGEILDRLCTAFEGAYTQAKASRRRPSTLEQQLFTIQELEWFSKNSYNFSLKHCAEIPPQNLARLLNVCAEFMKLLKEQDEEQPTASADIKLRLAFCEYLAACTYTTLARAEDQQEAYLQYYLEVRKHCQEFRRAVRESADDLSGAAQDDILSKQLQVVKLELEASLKLQRWDDLQELFDECWNCKCTDRYETLADLVLVIHGELVKSGANTSSQSKVLGTLQKIINLTSRENGNNVGKLSHWLRCLFNLTLSLDENISLKCLDQVTQIAAKKQGHTRQLDGLSSFMATPPPSSPLKLENIRDPADEELKQPDRYPAIELEWMATSAFNRAVDYYISDNDAKCKSWAEKAMMVAHWLEDDGQLRNLLMGKFSALQFDK